ncbi:hypothetical protein E2C01_063943 [Portunus trituberculatus]|uniref:Uncharacterized protein n=1 Tax=Portunus trituberculatus TaxID=210409 RepID=A0A5B7HF10_PORTR|nr:hypothetical protein [Portunus trituberculatus]
MEEMAAAKDKKGARRALRIPTALELNCRTNASCSAAVTVYKSPTAVKKQIRKKGWPWIASTERVPAWRDCQE